jgi:hypothetical protein
VPEQKSDSGRTPACVGPVGESQKSFQAFSENRHNYHVNGSSDSLTNSITSFRTPKPLFTRELGVAADL